MVRKFPLISIIIPVYNRQEVFTRSLQTALNQDYPNIEIIVVDDGSQPAIIVPVQSGNKNIQVVRQTNQGAPVARNFGFSKSRGEYVIFWDADVIAKPKFLSILFQALQNHASARYAYCDFSFGNKKMRAQEFDATELRRLNYITTSTLIRRADFPGFDPRLQKFQDWDLWLTLLEKNKIGVYVPGFLFSHEPGGTMSNWLPRFAYRAPWKWLPGIRAHVMRYEQARQILAAKHQLLPLE